MRITSAICRWLAKRRRSARALGAHARIARGARNRASLLFWACRFCNNLVGAFVNALAAFNAQRRLSRMRRGVIAGGELHRDEAGASIIVLMITLTYRPDVEWRPEHISSCLTAWREELGVQRLRYVWVLELTKAGRPHYHVVIWLPSDRRLRMPDRSGAWPHGMSRTEVARNPVGYLVKYATKGTDGGKLPRGARLFGVGGLSAAGRIKRAWRMLPRYQRVRCEADELVRRMKGGGWISRVTGEWWPAATFELSRLVTAFEGGSSIGVERQSGASRVQQGVS